MARYVPPLRVNLGFRTPPVARVIRPDELPGVYGMDDFVIVDVHAGPEAPYPLPPTGGEWLQYAQDEWLRLERKRTQDHG